MAEFFLELEVTNL